ncbi:hypothetical protein CWC46_12670 [Prodigiosinella confusarubida]|uniref:Uncharacterized protein n=1 Tax=Serratia sp. (strain ATCC 39006) TaxID=104623 RepID=A0A2I5TK27_SERS3|nr:hypothetical protein CWC46_12670 [Serratia sp. ATCC 39006]AUH04910.1 hypothetical protein Ser39006_012675 [Serratia sp. ATCC 39006]
MRKLTKNQTGKSIKQTILFLNTQRSGASKIRLRSKKADKSIVISAIDKNTMLKFDKVRA